MVKPGDKVVRVEITKSDNRGRDTGEEGYDVVLHFESGEAVVQEETYIHELDGEPNGIYIYDGDKYIQIENWEF
jgi:hypothetical protein